MSRYIPWWWHADPAPDFLKFLKEEDLRVIAAQQLDSQIATIDRQMSVLKLQMEDLSAQKSQLTQLKTMVGKRQ